jgi:hypothetical protein
MKTFKILRHREWRSPQGPFDCSLRSAQGDIYTKIKFNSKSLTAGAKAPIEKEALKP